MEPGERPPPSRPSTAEVEASIRALYEKTGRDVLSTLAFVCEVLNREGADLGLTVAPTLDVIHVLDLRAPAFANAAVPAAGAVGSPPKACPGPRGRSKLEPSDPSAVRSHCSTAAG
eukprot:RCo010336